MRTFARIGSGRSPLGSSLGLILMLLAVPGPAPARAAGFVVEYDYSTGGRFGRLGRAVEETEIFEETSAVLEKLARLPRDVAIRVVDRHPAGPHYDPSRETIVFPIAFLADHEGLLEREDRKASAEDIEEWLLDLAQFVIIHEQAHALIDVLDIPIVGREEDAADHLGVIILATRIESGADIALAAAEAQAIAGEAVADQMDEDDFAEAFFDEHSLDAQRVAMMLCLLYGSDPEALGALAEEIPEDRVPGCEVDYQEIRRSWLRLLKDSSPVGADDPEDETDPEDSDESRGDDGSGEDDPGDDDPVDDEERGDDEEPEDGGGWTMPWSEGDSDAPARDGAPASSGTPSGGGWSVGHR